MKKTVFPIVALLLILSLSTISCDQRKETNSSTSGIASVACDESFENIMNQEVEVFEYTYPKANIIPYYIDEYAAIDSLMSLKTQLAITAHKLTQQQIDYLKSKNRTAFAQRFAVDAIALIVNKQNTIDEVTISDLRDILTGVSKTWHDVEPSKLGKIQIVFDNQGSSTVRFMRDSILKGKPFTKEVYAQKSNKDVFKVVEQNKNAIGIIGVSWVTADMKGESKSVAERTAALQKNDTTTLNFSDRVKVLKVRRDNQIEGFQPYQAYIYDGSYPLYRSMYVISIAAGGSLSHGFLSFLTGFIGQKIIQNTGVLPAAIQPRLVSLN